MTKKQLEFESFRFDEANECVWEGGRPIQLRPKAYAILKYLIERPNVLVTKQQLLDDVWQDTFVSDAVLKDCAPVRTSADPLTRRPFRNVPNVEFASINKHFPASDRNSL